MNATNDSGLLMDLVNHSNFKEETKERLREKLNKSEAIKEKYILLKEQCRSEYISVSDDEDEVNEEVEKMVEVNERLIHRPNAYNIFVRQTMSELREIYPNKSGTELMTEAARMWVEKTKELKEVKKIIMSEIIGQQNVITTSA